MRVAEAGDGGALAGLRAGVLDGGDVSVLTERFERELHRQSTAKKSKLWIAELNRRPVAYARIQRCDVEDGMNLYDTLCPLPEGWYLRGLVVATEARRSGVATELTRIRLEALRELTTQCYCFLDWAEKESLPLYLRFGFGEISRDWKFADPQRTDSGLLLSAKLI